jgi:CRP-like cAMP-binding protein
MDAETLLKNNLASKIDITDADFEKVMESFKAKTIKKKKDLLRYGDKCKELAFVTKGALRTFSIDEKGVEHVIQIAIENNWISDLYSFVTSTASEFTIEAIEDTEVLIISTETLDKIYLTVPIMERFFRKLFERGLIAATQRINSTVSESAEVRYRKLMQNSPQILQRIPLVYIASYLGITPESLSRIRKNIF